MTGSPAAVCAAAVPEAAGDRGLPDVAAALLSVVASLVLPAAAIHLAGGGVVRLVYPLAVAMIAAVLMRRGPVHYPAYCIAVFAFSPFLRRLADYDAGFVGFNPVLLAPYAALLPAMAPLLRVAARGGSAWPFTVMLGCMAYACALAAFDDRLFTALYEPMRWVLPLALCAFIVESTAIGTRIRQSLVASLTVIVPILSAYGIYQYLDPPLWDVVWMQNVDNPTFGLPAAYQIRVFSMMNGPGSVAIFTAMAMIILFGERWHAVLAGATGLPLLALTVIRSSWLALGAGLIVILMLAAIPRKLAILSGIGAALLLLAGNQLLPVEIQNLLQERLNTFTSLSTDTSAGDRLQTYALFFDRIATSPAGEGFGVNSGTSTSGEQRDLVSLDSGILEIFLTFGIPAGTVYMIAVGVLIARALSAARRLRGAHPGLFATIAAVIVALPLGAYHLGELGVLAWLSLGLLLAAENGGASPSVASRFIRRNAACASAGAATPTAVQAAK